MLILAVFLSLLLYAALVFYVGRSGWRMLKPKAAALKLLYIIAVIVVASAFFLGQIFENVVLQIIGAFWMAFFCLLLMVLPLVQITVRLIRLTRLPSHHAEKWSNAAALLIVAALLVYGLFNAYSPVVRTYDVNIAKPNPYGQSMTIVMAADIHFGLLSGKGHTARMVEEINALQPDLVLLPGDIIDDDLEPFLEQGIPEILRGIAAPLGVYAVLGNHDKHNGPMQDIIDAFESAGIRVLYDEVENVADALVLVGRKDRMERDRAALAELVEGANRSKPLILLDHQPYELDIAQQNGIDLIVSGHTHRGQIAPGNLITSMLYELDWGYLRKEQLHAIVTSGYGFWGPPIRIGSRSELVRINVTFGDR